MSSMASSSSNPNPSSSIKERFFGQKKGKESFYDVFLSFHSECLTISSLQTSLRDAGIETFIDDDGEITPALSDAIDRSRIVIIVLTKHFGSCRNCVDKLSIMMGKKVVPLLCGLIPSDLSRMDGIAESMGWGYVLQQEFFKRKSSSLKTKKWFGEATWPSGWIMSTDCSSDNKEIKEMTLSIKMILDATYSEPRHLVGTKARVKEVLYLTGYYSSKHISWNGVVIVGIWGIGGIGKTTIARIIYNTIGDHFESKSFLESIKNVWEKDNGPACLQEQLISDISGTKSEKMHDTEMGIRNIKMALHKKIVLVVLDDISQIDQLMALCGGGEWVGVGSMILITTRYKHILDQLKVKYVYEVRKMNTSESLELFSWNAFMQPRPGDDFVSLAKKAITYCDGLPLILEVLGSLLFNKTVAEWKSVLKRLKRISTSQIQEKVKFSCEYLDDPVKVLFFNIACFYVGEEKQVVMQKSSGFQFPTETGIRVLIERRMVKVDMTGKLDMHDMLQEIGKEMKHNKPKSKYIYDVFLSFRGEDTRKSLANNLYIAFIKAGIEVFMDNGIRRGENISSSLMQAIESSKMCIIIFSINYADSRWCLQELEKIMECNRTTSQEVLPIFYGVQPSDVRKQVGAFGQKFESLITRILASDGKKLSWMRALKEAANLSGWDAVHYRTDAELIDHVVETITMKLDDSTLFVAHHQVGVKSRVQEIVELLNEKSNEILVVGIFGMGGSGKSTIAKAIYNKIGRSFEAKSFLSNIREAWEQENGPVRLQEQLLSDILQRRVALYNIESGKAIMKKRFCHKRALVLLDDVNNVDQLDVLYGSREWFGRGSRIIITTRDENVLKFPQADTVYNMKEMDDNESLELFSWHAFKQTSPIEDFIEPSRRVIAYCEGLPLALEILGSYLFDRPLHAWEGVLDRLKQLPNDKIHKKLKISFDGLDNDAEKDIFLDICCFFIGRERNYTTQILDGCRLHAEIGLTRLMELSLVKVDKNNKLHMHGLLRDMGREIIREMSPEEPEKRTRLWFHNDVVEVLTHHLGTRTIKGLSLNLPISNTMSFDTTTFKMMTRLRLLQLWHVKLDGNYKHLSRELRWLCWHGFPLTYMPDNFYQENVIAVDLKYSNLTQVWKKCQLLQRLKILKLSHSYYLRQTPDFSMLPNLEKLILKDCPRLSSIHQSIGDLKDLIVLNLKNCKDLNDLPSSLYNLKSLKTLNLSGCSKIDKLEEGFEKMKSLTTLLANETAIMEVPHSLVRSKSIKYVSLCGYEGVPHGLFSRLIWSWTSPTNSRRFLHQAFASMPFLLQHLFHGLSNQSRGNLEARRSTFQISRAKTPALIGYHDQIPTTRAESFTSSLTIQLGGFNKVTDTPLKIISQGLNDGGLHNSLPRENYLDWLVFENEGSSVSFEVPRVTDHCLKGMVLNIIYSSLQESMSSVYPIGFMLTNFTKGTMELYKRDATTSADYEWQKIISDLEYEHEVKVELMFAHKYIVKKTTIYLVYVEETDKLSITE